MSTVVEPAVDEVEVEETAEELAGEMRVRDLTRGGSAALVALWSGSRVLLGRACGCVPVVMRWGWDLASVDTEATARKQAKADAKAKAKAKEKAAKAKAAAKKAAAKDADEDQDDEDDDADEDEPDVKAPPVTPVRRNVVESAGVFALGGGLAAGALGTVGGLVGPYLHELAPYKSLILTVGGVAWAVAAWMLAPPPALVDADEDEVDGPEVDAATADIDEDQAEREAPVDPEPAPAPQRTRGELLAQHVLEVLADTEAKGGSGVHVVALLASAESAGLLAPGVTDKAALRQWLDASQIPVTKSVKVGGKVDYGVRVERVAEALGMPPREALARLLGGGPKAPAENPVQAPAPAHAETPHTVPLPASAGAADGAAQSGRLALVKTLPEGAAQGSAQGAA